jgi:hypothetical protein
MRLLGVQTQIDQFDHGVRKMKRDSILNAGTNFLLLRRRHRLDHRATSLTLHFIADFRPPSPGFGATDRMY